MTKTARALPLNPSKSKIHLYTHSRNIPHKRGPAIIPAVSCQLPNSRVPDSISGHSVKDLWRMKWHWDSFLYKCFGFSLSAIMFHITTPHTSTNGVVYQALVLRPSCVLEKKMGINQKLYSWNTGISGGLCNRPLSAKGRHTENKAPVTKWRILKRDKNSVALVRERTIPTERPPPVGEDSANFCG